MRRVVHSIDRFWWKKTQFIMEDDSSCSFRCFLFVTQRDRRYLVTTSSHKDTGRCDSFSEANQNDRQAKRRKLLPWNFPTFLSIPSRSVHSHLFSSTQPNVQRTFIVENKNISIPRCSQWFIVDERSTRRFLPASSFFSLWEAIDVSTPLVLQSPVDVHPHINKNSS